MSDKEGNAMETGQDIGKSQRTTRGSQTGDLPSKSGETNLPTSIEATSGRNQVLSPPCLLPE